MLPSAALIEKLHIVSAERVLCLLKEHAEGTYKTKHAEAARFYYTTKLLVRLHYDI